MDVPSEHHLNGTMGRRGLTRLKDSLVHKNVVSLSALFLLTFHWCRHLSNSSARLVTSGLYSSLMNLLPKDCRITVRLNPREQDPRVAEVIVVARVVQPCSAHQLVWPQSPWLEIAWPRVLARREQLLEALLHLAEVNAMLVVHVLNAVSFTMELPLREAQQHPGNSTALVVMQVLFSGSVHEGTRFVAREECLRHHSLVQSTEASHGHACVSGAASRASSLRAGDPGSGSSRGHTWATAPDATRFSGRD